MDSISGLQKKGSGSARSINPAIQEGNNVNNLHKPKVSSEGYEANEFGRKWNIKDSNRPIGAHYNARYGYLTETMKSGLRTGRYDGNALAIVRLAAYAEMRRIAKTLHNGKRYHARDFTSVGYVPLGK